MSNQSIKVLFVARPNLYTSKGGDTTQMEKTAKFLKPLGVEATIYNGKQVNYNEFDLIHYFNLIDPEDILGSMYATKIPKVLSPIFVKYDEYDKYHRKGIIGLLSKFLTYNQVEYLKTIAKFVLKGEKISSYRYFLMGHGASMQKIINEVSHLLPNSNSELKRLEKEFTKLPNATVVTNAIDHVIFNPLKVEVKRENIVLCVGRVEGIKNQHNLIKAALIGGFKLKIIGNFADNQPQYERLCKQLANGNVEFIPFLPQTDLVKLYATAKVHVLPSWFETTGLSSLEAAAMGCNVVVTDKGDVREYFGDLAYYCDPSSPTSIAEAINKAFYEPVNPELRKLVVEKYTWERAAQQTLSVYKKVLNK